MSCTCGISTFFGIFEWSAPVPVSFQRSFTALTMSWLRGIATDFNMTCACGTSCSAGAPTSLSVYCNNGFKNRLNHLDLPLRQDRNFDDLVDGMQLLSLQALSGSSRPVVVFRLACRDRNLVQGLHLLSLRWFAVWCLSRSPALLSSLVSQLPTCVEDETVDSLDRFCCEGLDVVVFIFSLLGHELSLQLVSPTSPAVGIALFSSSTAVYLFVLFLCGPHGTSVLSR